MLLKKIYYKLKDFFLLPTHMDNFLKQQSLLEDRMKFNINNSLLEINIEVKNMSRVLDIHSESINTIISKLDEIQRSLK